MASKRLSLRSLLDRGTHQLPGAHNGATALAIERAGFSAVYISGAGLANATVGVPDIGLLTLTEVAQLAGYIARAVRVSTLADADTGFGGPESAARTVGEFIRAGIGGLHLEDQQFPKRCGHLAGKSLVAADEMVEKLRAAAGERDRLDRDFVLVARTDARAVEGLEAAIGRAREYMKAGADAIFPEALQSAAEFEAFAREVKAPLVANMTEFGRSPLLGAEDLSRLGYRLLLYPQSAFRASMYATTRLLDDLKKRGTQEAWLEQMQTREELYKLLRYDPQGPWSPR